jgi:hypothetical protein
VTVPAVPAVRYAANDPDIGVLAMLSDSSAIAGATLDAAGA